MALKEIEAERLRCFGYIDILLLFVQMRNATPELRIKAIRSGYVGEVLTHDVIWKLTPTGTGKGSTRAEYSCHVA